MKKICKIVAIIAISALAFGSFASCSKKTESSEKPTKEKSTRSLKNDVLKENPASDFKYTMTDDGQGVKITKYIGKNSKIIIPATIEELPVLEVENLADLDHEYGELYWSNIDSDWIYPRNNITITHISFPDTVRSTGSTGLINIAMFLSDYDALEYIKFSAGMETHPNEGKYGGKPTLSVTTGKPVLESSMPYVEGCDKLTTVIIPEGVRVLPIFAGCTSLKSVTLPSTVEVIPQTCFQGCSSLEEIIIPETVTQITFQTKADIGWGKYHTYDTFAFEKTNFNLTTQAKLKQLGYTGKF